MPTEEQTPSGSLMDTLVEEYVHTGARFLHYGEALKALTCAVKALHVNPGYEEAEQLARTAGERIGAPPVDDSDGEVQRLLAWTERLDRACAGQREVVESASGDPLGFLVPDLSGAPPDEPLGEVREALALVSALVRQERPERRALLEGPLANLCLGVGVTEEDIGRHEGHVRSSSSSVWHLALEHELHNTANVLYKAQRLNDACECYDLVLEQLRPDLLETLFNRALCLTRLRRYYQALGDIDRVVDLNPNLAEAHYTRGLILEYMEDYDRALGAYNRALAVDHKYQKARVQADIAAGKKRAKESGGALPPPPSSGRTEDHQEITNADRYLVRPEVTMADVAGCEIAKTELRKVIAYLDPVHRPTLEEWGVDLPTGVLLYGPPRCGKTLLVRACAGEVRCPVYSVPARELVSMWAGQTERNLGHLWDEASQHPKAILHFSEFDHLGGRRTDMRDPGGEHWSNRTIDALLDLMDGMRGRCPGLAVIGDTNLVDNIDPALLTPGRFGTVIEVPPPVDLVEWAEVWLVLLATEEKRASRVDVYDLALREVLRADRREWLAQAFTADRLAVTGADGSGLDELARLSLEKSLVPGDVAEVIRRTKDERAMLKIADEVTLGPIETDDLKFHLVQYQPFRGSTPPPDRNGGTMVG